MRQTAEANRRWLEGYRAVFERADRIVTGSTVRVVLDDTRRADEAPGWTDGNTIFLSKRMMLAALNRGEYREMLLAIKGINYHEVAHCLFTPRSNTKVVREVRAQGYARAFNILEDFRAESLFVATFKTARLYFTNTVIAYILDWPESDLKSAYVLLAGRKYLPQSMTAPLRKLFIDSHPGQTFHSLPIADALDALADEYVKLVYPRDNKRALGIIEDFYNLLRSLNKMPPHGCNPGQDSTKGRPVTQGEQEVAQDNLEVAEEEWDDEEDDLDESDTSSSDEEDGDSESDEDSLPGGDSNDDDETSGDEEGGSGGNTDSDSSPTDAGGKDAVEAGTPGEGSTTGDPSAMTEESVILDSLKDLADAIAASETVAEDLQDTHEAVRAELQAEVESIPATPARFQRTHPTLDDLTARASIVKHLRDIQADLSPRWNRQQSSGYVDVNEAIAASFNPGNRDVFESWDAGREDEASTEIVLLLDQSGSMSGPLINNASRMLWSLREAMRKVGIRVSALGFSDGHTKLYDPGERTSEVKMFGVYGGTQPLYALHESLPVFERTSAYNKVLVIITDGGWTDHSGHLGVYAKMDKLGVTRMLIRLGDERLGKSQFAFYEEEKRANNPATRHYCHIVENVMHPSDVAPAVEKLVAHLMTERGRA